MDGIDAVRLKQPATGACRTGLWGLEVRCSAYRAGIGSGLLERAVQWSREAGLMSLCCQVHDRPLNRDAHAFVMALGFTALESVMLPSRDIVTMYQRSTATATP